MEIRYIIIAILLCLFHFNKPSVNGVRDVHDNFKEWIADNSDRIDKATERGTLPYFIRDNRGVVDAVLKEKVKPQAPPQETRQDKTCSLVPPHVDEYVPYNDGKIMVSPLHGKDELESNLRLAQTMYDILGETVYLLPNINPKGADAHLRAEYIPEGVKKDKNADFLCANRIWDGKEASFEKSDRSRKSIKSIIENHIKKAKQQADNMIIEIPNWVKEEWVDQTIRNHLTLTNVDRWIIIKRQNGECKLYKK